MKSSVPTSLENIIVRLKVQAGRKNPYFIYFPKTDSLGRSVLLREDYIGQFTDHWQAGLMDYDGKPEDAIPLVEVSLFDPTWHINNRAIALAWPLLTHEQTKWQSREQQYEYLISCCNQDYSAEPITVDIEGDQHVDLMVVPR